MRTLCRRSLAIFCTSLFVVAICRSYANAATEPAWAPQLLGMQFTGIYQNMPAFHDPYEGPNSLKFENGEGHNITHTYGLYLGSQLAPLLQTYLDIEMARGAGISNGVGLGGYTNGDVIRTGTVDLGNGPYIARLYLRYLIPLSPATEILTRSMDQLPGAEAASRVEIKAGRLSVADDFDQNRYANNTRTQFLNYGLINNTAWDYSGDTRGYSNGLVIALVRPSWRLALGSYQMGTTANGNEFDGHLDRARGNNLELTVKPYERGIVLRFLVYYNEGRMGNYEEALFVGRETATIPNVIEDEKPGRTKYGLGVNIEQPLADDGETGLFARFGWNDGHNENFSFAEVDRHLSAGMQVCGVHWNRTDDRLGIGYIVHGLSPEHREYLSAGGTGFLLGDGKLTYALEQILEAYYRFQVSRYAQLSPDFQYILNPGYNGDRGPVEVYSLRLRLNW